MYLLLIIFILKIIYKSFYFLLYVFPDRFIFYLFLSHLFFIFLFLLILTPSVNLSVDTLAVSGDSFFVEAISIFFVFAHTYFYFSVSAHAYPFRQPNGWHLPRQAGTAFFESFPCFSILLILFSIFLCLPTLTPFVNLSVDTLAVSGDSFFVGAISIFFVFAHTYFYSSVSAHAYPFRQPFGWHLPRQAGTACGLYPILLWQLPFNFIYKNLIAFSLSRSLPPHTEGSAEPCKAIGASLRTEVRIFNTCILCQILHFVREWRAGI